MKKKGWPSFRACLPLALCMAILTCLRIPWIAVNPLLNNLAEALMVMLLALAMRTGLLSMALLFAVLGPLCAWLLDVVDGPMALVYGAATLAMAYCFVLSARHHPVIRAATGALAASAVVILGTALTLILSREMTPGAALGYASTRQVWQAAVYFLGGLIYLVKR